MNTIERNFSKAIAPNTTNQQILTYYQSTGYETGEEFSLLARGQYSIALFGIIHRDHIQLWKGKSVGKDQDGVTIWKKGKAIANPIQYLQKLGDSGYNISSYPNHVQGGLGTKYAAGFTSLYWEHDDLSLDEQWAKVKELESLTGLKPCLSVFSGGKSLHNYLRLDRSIPPDQWQLLQRMLIVVLNSDNSLDGLSHGMRLPGINRVKNRQVKAVEIVGTSDAVYRPEAVKTALEATGKFPYGLSAERFRKWKREGDKVLTVPEAELFPKPKRTTYTPLPVNTSGKHIPLEACLTRTHKEELNGVDSNRNDTAYSLARDLIGAADWLNHEGYSTDDPYNLFLDFCKRCPSEGQWHEREWESIWHSAQRGNPSPARGDEGIKTSAHCWLWENDEEYQKAYKRTYAQEQGKKEGKKSKKGDRLISTTEWGKNGIVKFSKFLKEQIKVAPPKQKKIKPTPKPVEVIHWNTGDPVPQRSLYAGKEPPVIEFAPGADYQQLLEKLMDAGWTTALDDSLMGSGKSERASKINLVGIIEPEEIEEENKAQSDPHQFYIDPNHTNPSLRAIATSYKNLYPRHNGMWINDEEKLSRKGEGYPDIRGNCPSADLFIAFAQKGHEIEGRGNPICEKCPNNPHKEKKDGEDEEKGFCLYKAGRQDTLSETFIRADLNSLPNPEEFGYSTSVAIIEEASIQARGCLKEVDGDWGDILEALDKIEQASHPIHQKLSPIKESLRSLFKGAEGQRYGLEHEEMMKVLPTVQLSEKELSKLRGILAPAIDLDEADSVKGLEKEHKAAQKLINSVFRRETREENKDRLEQIPPNILLPLLSILNGEKGSIRISRGKLTITRPDYRKQSIIQSMGFRLFLDATGNRQAIAAGFGLEENEIITIRQEQPNLDNLTVFQTHMSGIKTAKGKSEKAKARIQAYKEYKKAENPDTIFLGFKGDEDINGYWHNHNRGSNAYKGKVNLTSFGLPFPNIGAIKAEYQTFFGNLDGFDDYYQSLVIDEIIQFGGRPRAQHYPDTQFSVDIVATFDNFDLDFLTERYGITVIKRDAVEVCPECGTTKEKLKNKIVEMVAVTSMAGENLTQQAIATQLGISQQALSKHLKSLWGSWSDLKTLLQLFLKELYSESCKTESQPPSTTPPPSPVKAVATLIDLFNIGGLREIKEFLLEIPPPEARFYLACLLSTPQMV